MCSASSLRGMLRTESFLSMTNNRLSTSATHGTNGVNQYGLLRGKHFISLVFRLHKVLFRAADRNQRPVLIPASDRVTRSTRIGCCFRNGERLWGSWHVVWSLGWWRRRRP